MSLSERCLLQLVRPFTLTIVWLCAISSERTIITPAVAQSGCVYPPQSGRGTWPQDDLVTVNIDPSFSQAERDAIQTAFQKWQNHNTGASAVTNYSNVRFTFTYES